LEGGLGRRPTLRRRVLANGTPPKGNADAGQGHTAGRMIGNLNKMHTTARL
jgi:hypothetical protein